MGERSAASHPTPASALLFLKSKEQRVMHRRGKEVDRGKHCLLSCPSGNRLSWPHGWAGPVQHPGRTMDSEIHSCTIHRPIYPHSNNSSTGPDTPNESITNETSRSARKTGVAPERPSRLLGVQFPLLTVPANFCTPGKREEGFSLSENPLGVCSFTLS